MNKKRRELLKTIVIVLLIISAVTLVLSLSIPDEIIESSSLADFLASVFSSSSLPDRTNGGSYSVAARPVYASVNLGDGERYGVKYDETELGAVYDTFSIILGEALGTAGEPVMVDVDEWKQVLSSTSVYFDYLYDQSLSVLSSWLSTGMSSSASLHSVRRIVLADSDDGLQLYYIRSRDGVVYRCDTALEQANFLSLVEGFAANGSKFAFELSGIWDSIDEYMLVASGSMQQPELNVKNPISDALTPQELMELFELNSVVAYSYSETDGTQVYVDGDATLRISPDGTVAFRQTGGEKLNVSYSANSELSDTVEYAFALAMRCVGEHCGSAGLQLSNLAYDTETGEYTITFQYVYNSLPILRSDGRACAEISIGNGVVTRATMCFRSYEPTGGTLDLLPEIQAVAIISAKGGGEPLLCYEDDGIAVSAQWIKND